MQGDCGPGAVSCPGPPPVPLPPLGAFLLRGPAFSLFESNSMCRYVPSLHKAESPWRTNARIQARASAWVHGGLRASLNLGRPLTLASEAARRAMSLHEAASSSSMAMLRAMESSLAESSTHFLRAAAGLMAAACWGEMRRKGAPMPQPPMRLPWRNSLLHSSWEQCLPSTILPMCLRFSTLLPLTRE